MVSSPKQRYLTCINSSNWIKESGRRHRHLPRVLQMRLFQKPLTPRPFTPSPVEFLNIVLITIVFFFQLRKFPLLYPHPPFTHVVHLPTFYSEFKEVVDVHLNFFRHILMRVTKTLYLFSDTERWPGKMDAKSDTGTRESPQGHNSHLRPGRPKGKTS